MIGTTRVLTPGHHDHHGQTCLNWRLDSWQQEGGVRVYIRSVPKTPPYKAHTLNS